MKTKHKTTKIDYFERFLCIDNTVYPIGASLKDLGKKWFAFSRMKIGAEGLRRKM